MRVFPTTVSGLYEQFESQVRSYCRSYPNEFDQARGSHLFDTHGSKYLDFLSGCGTLNYGHNDPFIKSALLDYIASDGLAMCLDFHCKAKSAFLSALNERILRPRGLDYRAQFTGPTGANAVEAALKLARKHTGRSVVVSFTNGFHGVSLGALAASGNIRNRSTSEGQLHNIHRAPFDGYMGEGVCTADLLDKMLSDPSSGIGPPAAILFEPIQGEGGLNCASPAWARRISAVAKRHGALVIADEIQAGCGRSGDFFAFDHLGIRPDIVTMAKSLSGLGLPLSLVLLSPEIDVWAPGEHNGTFRGNAHAFVTATAALDKFWADDAFVLGVREKGRLVHARLSRLAEEFDLRVAGRGLMLGLDVGSGVVAQEISEACYAHRLILETCGAHGQVLKLLMPLTISDEDLEMGLSIIETTVKARLGQRRNAIKIDTFIRETVHS